MPEPHNKGYVDDDRERGLAEFVYEQGFWDGVRAAREADVALPQDWISRDVDEALNYARDVLSRRAPQATPPDVTRVLRGGPNATA